MAYQPLTEEQYNKALNAGFSSDAITQMEKQRKIQENGIEPQETFGAKIVGGKAMTGQEFINQPYYKQVVQAFVQTLPKDFTDFFVKAPAELAVSAGEALSTPFTGGKPQGIEFNVPIVGKVKGLVSQSQESLRSGSKPFGWHAFISPVIQAVSDGLVSTQELKGIVSTSAKLFGDAPINNLSKFEPGLLQKTFQQRGQIRTAQTALDALTPNFGGKKLIGAYTSDFGQGATKAGIFSKQSPAVSDETIKIANNVGDLVTSKDPLKNLQSLGNGMNEVENQLTPLLKEDKTLLGKVNLLEKLNNVKTEIPQEFDAIKENKTLFNRVIDFGRKVISNSDDTINGGREARILFDTQAKNEFPSAFNSMGFIDTSKPAGRAIKLVRDTINNHIYDTAKEGNQIKELIGREADIYKAVQIVGQKAAKLNGLNKIQQLFKQNPTLGRLIKVGITATIGGEVLKHTGILP